MVGLGTGDVMLDAGPSSPLKKGTAPYFSAHVKMPNDRKVDLGPGHTVLDGDPVPPLPPRGTATQFSAHVCCGQMAGWIKMRLGIEVGLGPGYFVL